MIRYFIITCDWPGCSAEMIWDFQTLTTNSLDWRFENVGPNALHLCAAHAQKTWAEVHEVRAGKSTAPDLQHPD
jgi:hypothetical protein